MAGVTAFLKDDIERVGCVQPEQPEQGDDAERPQAERRLASNSNRAETRRQEEKGTLIIAKCPGRCAPRVGHRQHAPAPAAACSLLREQECCDGPHAPFRPVVRR